MLTLAHVQGCTLELWHKRSKVPHLGASKVKSIQRGFGGQCNCMNKILINELIYENKHFP